MTEIRPPFSMPSTPGRPSAGDLGLTWNLARHFAHMQRAGLAGQPNPEAIASFFPMVKR
jgi:hypothetical protein